MDENNRLTKKNITIFFKKKDAVPDAQRKDSQGRHQSGVQK
jgi:hypothetical protein